MLLQWYSALIKYVEYTDEFGRVCACLQLLAKGNDDKIQRFIDVVEQNQGYLDMGLFMNALLKLIVFLYHIF